MTTSISIGPGITFGRGMTVGAGASDSGSYGTAGVNGTIGYSQIPGPIIPGNQIEDSSATINGTVGFTVNTLNGGQTGIAVTNLTASNQAFFTTYGTGTRTVTWGAGSTYASTTVNLVNNTSGQLVFYVTGISVPATFNFPFTFQ